MDLPTAIRIIWIFIVANCAQYALGSQLSASVVIAGSGEVVSSEFSVCSLFAAPEVLGYGFTFRLNLINADGAGKKLEWKGYSKWTESWI